MADSSTAVLEREETATVVRQANKKTPPKRQPRYQVILWDDSEHTYDYVIRMMQELFGHSFLKGFEIAEEVDLHGKAICLTTTKEHAELKRDQIHAFGKDPQARISKGSMSASIEPLPE
jgi:ATP-dependent Clp protease adaptor protein ClpS